MRSGYVKLLSALIVTILLGMCIPVLMPASDADDYDQDGDYGSVSEFSYEEVDKFIKELTGKTTQELIKGLEVFLPGYTLDLIPSLTAKTSIERNTQTSGDDYYIHDKIDSYVESIIMFDSDGPYPEAGDYWMEDGESVFGFLGRIFTKEASKEVRHVSLNYLIAAYIDTEVDTHIDLATGELTSVDISLRVFITLVEDSNMYMDPYYDENDDMIGMNLSYGHTETYSNIYVGTGMHMSVSGLRVINDDEIAWECSPTVMLTFEKFAISSDVADGILKAIISSAGDDNPKLAIPELLIKIIKGASRMLDVFETMKSLTDMKIPDIKIESDVTVWNYIDPYGYKYAWVSMINGKGVEKTLLISFGPYVFDVSMLVDLIPSDILSDEKKVLVNAALAVLGLLTFNVADISDDPVTEEKIAAVNEYVDKMIKYDEEPNYSIPDIYIYASVVGFIALLGVGILYWRRLI